MSDDPRFEKIVQFIRELYHQPEGVIPLHAPVFAGNEKKYLIECIDSTYVSYVGEFVARFEHMIADYTGAKYVVAVVNGTVALQIALLVSGVESDDEVITQPLTFVATANAIRHANAWPVFIDVDRDTLGMSPESLTAFLDKHVVIKKGETFNKATGRRIKAIVPMHTFGFPARIDEIVAICNEYNVPVVEDAAESLGSFYKGKHTGTFGKIAVLSFNGNKILTTGGGGMLLFQDEVLAEKAKHMTTQAKVPHPWEYIHDNLGYNYRMPNINAALGVAQMERIEEIIENKRQTAHNYREFFSTNQQINKSTNLIDSTIQFICEPIGYRSNYWLNTITLNNRKERDEFLKYTNENGIMTRPIWRLMNKLEMFKNAQTGNLENSEWLEDRAVNLPSSIRKK